ncbi:MAG: glycerol-3-phosphate dehydrogenase [Candidatus Puniceispirillum sp.]|nr:glycerol-3-phosphate dehydrogenase [Candidatus Puniceispirillum sp.]
MWSAGLTGLCAKTTVAFNRTDRSKMTSVSVIGAGAWGTALALVAHRAGRQVTLIAQDANEARDLLENRTSPRLPEAPIPPEIVITHGFDAAATANITLVAVPAQVMRVVTTELATRLQEKTYLVICAKGIELDTGLLMSEIVEETLEGHSLSVLSGPTFARDVATGHPAAACIAHAEITTARWLASSLSSPTFRLHPTSDVVGVEIAGSLKNVIAIAAGIVTAKGYGESARAALVTRGLHELSRLGLAMGGQAETFAGLSGVGDLVLCCTSQTSRNMALGYQLGAGLPVDSHLLTEGSYTAKAVLGLCDQLDLELPICEAVNKILEDRSMLDTEVDIMFTRALKGD